MQIFHAGKSSARVGGTYSRRENLMRRYLFVRTIIVAVFVPMIAVAQFGNLKLEVPKPAVKKTLSMGDIEPGLAKFPIVFEGVQYEQIEEQPFDDFFRSAAKLNGLSELSVLVSDQATTQLKNYARSKYADEELRKSIDELTGNTPPEDWTVDQAFAVEQLAKERKKISGEESQYFVTTGGAIIILAGSIAKGVESSGDLLKQGSQLLQKAQSLPGSKTIAGVSATKTSIENLEKFTNNAPLLVKQLYALATGFQSL